MPAASLRMPPIKRRAAARSVLLGWLAVVASAHGQANDCATLGRAYRDALPPAQACQPGAAGACAATRPAALDDPCRCKVAVNPARTQELDRLIKQYQAGHCAQEPGFCNRACVAPATGCLAAALCGSR